MKDVVEQQQAAWAAKVRLWAKRQAHYGAYQALVELNRAMQEVHEEAHNARRALEGVVSFTFSVKHDTISVVLRYAAKQDPIRVSMAILNRALERAAESDRARQGRLPY